MSIFKRLIPTLLIFAFEIAIGVMVLINGEKFTQVIFIIFAVLLMLGGLVTLIRSLLDARNGGSLPLGKMVFAVILLGIGAFFAAASGAVLSVMSALWVVIGLIMIANGMIKMIEFAAFRSMGAVAWFALIDAVITIILGFIITFNPFGATAVAWTIFGIMIIVSAAIDIISLITFAVALKKMPPTVIEVDVKKIEK